MQPLGLNLASRPFRNNTILWTAYILAAGLLIGYTAWNVRTYLDREERLDALGDELSTVDRRMSDLDLRERRAAQGIERHDIKYLEVQADKANDVIDRKALSWTLLFNRMEGVMPWNVRMTSIRPVYRQERATGKRDLRAPEGSVPVSVEGMAQNLDAFVKLEENLLEDPHFDRVEPERSVFTDQREVRFELRFLYFPEGPEGDETGEAAGEAGPPAVADGVPEAPVQEGGE